MQRKIQITSDGSSTIYIPEMDETYHSSHGAIQEARHVFLKHGIETINKEVIDVFEMGFGTGLNALLTYEWGDQNNKSINYIGIEAFPVEMRLVQELNYIDEIGSEFTSVFKKMHSAEWDNEVMLSDRFKLHKIYKKIEDYELVANSVDIIYFDAFGPRAQRDMWHISILEKMKMMLRPGGILVTYCAMGQFKRDLKSLGFSVEGRPGPPGKREMTLASLV